jgi:hypothetical protein
MLARRIVLILTTFALGLPTLAQALNNPVMFVTQMPIPADFATIASTFGH